MEDVLYEFRAGVAPQLNRHSKNLPHDGSAGTMDTRMARLLLVLSEVDECVASLGGLPESQIHSLVSTAIQACGFTNPAEVRSVVASILQAIGVHPTDRREML